MANTLSRVLGAAALAVSLATAGPADAAQQRPVETRTDPTPSYRLVPATSESAPPSLAPNRRTITSEVVPRGGRLFLRGDVQSWYRRHVTIQRSACESCSWRRYEVVSTGRRGGFRSGIGAPKRGSTFWRAKVPASDGFARSYSAIWETFFP